MRQGESVAAVDCYEQAAERYAALGMHTSAIALCNKALRIAPDRISLYRKLGGLHARTGLLAEGRRSCMVFVERAIQSGNLSDAKQAVEEFAAETGDEQIRLAYMDVLQSSGATTAAVGEAVVAVPEPPQPTLEEDPVTRETLNLATLVAAELGRMDFESGFDPIRPVCRLADPPGSRTAALDGTRLLLGRFRAQLGEPLPDDDLTVRYDLGVEFMTIGLIDEAIEEFQRAIQHPALVEAANARIAECLASRRSFKGIAAHTNVELPPVDEEEIHDVVADSEADSVELAGVPEDETAAGVHDEEVTEDDTTELEGHYFRARLAQYRIRRAEDRHTTDFGAHVELGAAYAEMDLQQEAVREFAVAVKGPRPIASRASRALRRLGESPETLPELAIHIVEVLSIAAMDDVANDLAETLAVSWGDDHPLADRLAALRKEIVRAAEELPSLESLFPGVGIPHSDPEQQAATDSNDLRELDALLSELEDGEGSDGIGEALRVDDEHIQVLKAAETHREEGRLEEAEAVLISLLDQLMKTRRPREAMTVVDRLLVLRPDDVPLYHQKTELALMVNDRHGLLAAYAQLGACLRRQGASRSARTAFGRILDFDPENSEARAAISELDREELEFEKRAASDQSSERLVRTHASDAERSEFDAMLDDLGLDKEEDRPGVVPDSSALSDSDEPDPGADAASHCELGLAFHQMGMWEEAADELRAALPYLEDTSEALAALGESLHQAGNHKEAIEELAPFIEVAATDGSMVGALYYLAQALRAEGRDSEARDTLARVEAASPGYRDTAELLSQLSL